MDAAPLLTDQRPALLRSATVPSPLGELLLVASPVGLVQVFLPSSKGVPASSEEPHDPGAYCLPEARAQLHAYLAGELTDFDLPLDLHGSPFQKQPSPMPAETISFSAAIKITPCVIAPSCSR